MVKKRFTTHDIVLMALLAVTNAVVTNLTAFINKFLTAIGGPVATSVIVGLYIIYGILALYIIRKPGAALITYLIGATIQTLLGNSYGAVAAYGAALSYAVAIEAVFALVRYRNWGYFPVIIASFLATVVWFPLAAYLFGYFAWETPVLVATFIVRCVSGIMICGMFTKWGGDKLSKTGLLRFYAAGQVQRQGEGSS